MILYQITENNTNHIKIVLNITKYIDTFRFLC